MATPTMSIPGIGQATAFALSQHGIRTAEDLAAANEEELAAVPGFGASRAARAIRSAQQLIGVADPAADTIPAQEPKTDDTVEPPSEKKADKRAVKKSKVGKKAKKKKKGKDRADKPEGKKKPEGSKKGKKARKSGKGKKKSGKK